MMKRLVVNALVAAGVCCACCASDRTFLRGNLSKCDEHANLNCHFGKVAEFLKRQDLMELPVGRYEIDGDNCWAMVQEVELKPLEERKVEAHRKYIDIHVPLSGPETIGVFDMDDGHLSLPFDEKNDFVLFQGKTKPLVLHPGEYAVFFPPRGGHAPGCQARPGDRKLRKLVIKVKDENDLSAPPAALPSGRTFKQSESVLLQAMK